jgi:hypothetical protein
MLSTLFACHYTYEREVDFIYKKKYCIVTKRSTVVAFKNLKASMFSFMTAADCVHAMVFKWVQ